MRWAFSTAARMVWWRCIRPDWRCQLLWLPSFRYKVVLFHNETTIYIFSHTQRSQNNWRAKANKEQPPTRRKWTHLLAFRLHQMKAEVTWTAATVVVSTIWYLNRNSQVTSSFFFLYKIVCTMTEKSSSLLMTNSSHHPSSNSNNNDVEALTSNSAIEGMCALQLFIYLLIIQ